MPRTPDRVSRLDARPRQERAHSQPTTGTSSGALLAWLAGRTPTPLLLHQFRLERQGAGRRPRTIEVDFTAAFGFFGWLHQEGPAQGLPRPGSVTLPSLDDAQRAKPTDDEVTALFAAAAGMPQHTDRKRYLRGRALCILSSCLALAGLRRGELLALNVPDVLVPTWTPGTSTCGSGKARSRG